MSANGQLLPTRDLAFTVYPQREVDAPLPALRDAWRWLRAALCRAGSARLASAVQRGIETARAQMAGGDEIALLHELPQLRARLRAGGLQGAALGHALALVAEMARRRLGQAPYPTQILAASLMLEGSLAEMATGEGKTLAAGLAAATAALAGVPVHLLTANDYLVQRDREKLAPLYEALGLSSACVLPSMPRPEREAAYRCDIVYLSARELVFDYLRDHVLLRGARDPRLLNARAMSRSAEGGADAPSACHDPVPALDAPTPVLPGLCLAIIDEADSILLDEATVPLILAAPADAVQTESYRRAMDMTRTLRRGRDYALHAGQHRAELSEEGRAAVSAAVQELGASAGLLRPARRAHELVEAALSACHALRRDRDYAVLGGRLLLIDEVTGRIADGRQWTGALQAMVELKEGLPPSPATRVAAQITYQRFFPRYLRVGGMSGTLLEARRELRVLYGGVVRRVPLAQPDRSQWWGERLYTDTTHRDAAIVERVRRLIGLGRPVLVGTDSVAASMRVSSCLRAAGIDNQLLNAVQDATEAADVERAGRSGVVTVATNMAGRGTDIHLDPAARAAGGLHVIAAMRNRSRRIDRQLIGRAARHGDPGSAERMLALDDRLIVEHAARGGRALARRCARDALVPAWLAQPLLALAQRRAEAAEAGLRRRLQRTERYAEEHYGFAGGTE